MSKFNKVQLTTDQLASRDENIAFDFQSRSVCALFARLARDAKISLPTGWGVLGEYRRDQTDIKFSFVYGLYRLSLSEDITEVNALNASEKNLFFLNLIKQLIELTGEYYEFDVSGFRNVADQVVETDFVNIWEWKAGRKYSPTRKYRSRVHVNHKMNEVELILSLLLKDGSVAFEKIVSCNCKPDETLIDNLLGELKWNSENEIQITSKIRGHKPMIIEIPVSNINSI
jgi:hypothetical protein